MNERRVMTHEEYERILKRIYSQGYVVNLREREKVKTVEDVAFYVPRLGYAYDIEEFVSRDAVLETELIDDDRLNITCYWGYGCPELSSIQEWLQGIVSEEIPDLVFDLSTTAPNVSDMGIKKYIHTFKFAFHNDK